MKLRACQFLTRSGLDSHLIICILAASLPTTEMLHAVCKHFHLALQHTDHSAGALHRSSSSVVILEVSSVDAALSVARSSAPRCSV